MKKCFASMLALLLGGWISAQTVVTQFSENFNSALTTEQLSFWSPNTAVHSNSTPIFSVSQDLDAGEGSIKVLMKQKDFFDGQMYRFKDAAGLLLNLNEAPVFSMRIKIDPAETDYRVWNWGTNKADPATTIPFQVSVWRAGARIAGQNIDVPIDGVFHSLLYSFAGADIDLNNIDHILIETVTWRPDAFDYGTREYFNKALYWMDDVKIGKDVELTPVSSIEINTAGDVTTIDQKGKTLQFGAVVLPAGASITSVSWKVIPGSGYGRISNAGLFTPVSDGTVKVVGITRDGSSLSDTIELTLSNQTQTVDSYAQTFNSDVDLYLWRPHTGTHPGGTPIFTVDRNDNALRVNMKQRDFFDGQMYRFEQAEGKLFNLAEAPVFSMKIKIDPAQTDWKVWNWGTSKADPATTMPFQVSVWKDGVKLAGQNIDVPIDNQFHDLIYSFAAPNVDLSGIDAVLIESVTWRPDAFDYGTREYFNKALYWMDDFRIGKAVQLTAVTSVDIKTAGDATTIVEKGKTLQFSATLLPENASITSLSWKVLPGTGYGRINDAGLFTPVSDGTVKVVGITRDGTSLSDTLELTLSNQTQVVTSYSQNFNADVDMNLWAPNKGSLEGGLVMFKVDRDDNNLRVNMQQKEFFDGQMYNFKQFDGKVFNLSEKPIMSMKVKIDPAGTNWIYPEWNASLNNVQMPFGVSAWSNGERISGEVKDVKIDGQWYELYYSFAKADADLTAIEWILIESVTWPNANKALYRMDDLKLGAAVTLPSPVTAISVSGAGNATSINTKAGTLKMTAAITPEQPTIGGVTWKVNDVTVATINEEGLLTAVMNGAVTVTATAKDGSGISGSIDITVTNQNVSVPGTGQVRFNIYPNPASDHITVVSDEIMQEVRIINTSGQIIHAERINTGNTRIDVAGFEKGIYMIQVVTNRGVTTKPVVIKY